MVCINRFLFWLFRWFLALNKGRELIRGREKHSCVHFETRLDNKTTWLQGFGSPSHILIAIIPQAVTKVEPSACFYS